MNERDPAGPGWMVRARPPTPSEPGLAYALRCECELCRQGLTTELHADASHDHRWSQTFELPGDPAGAFTLLGGTSKSARALLGYLLAHPRELAGRRVLELGAGTGLVAIGLARCTSHREDGYDALRATDQEPVVPMLAENLAEHTSHTRRPPEVATLTWGEPLDVAQAALWAPDVVLCADLNFARENLGPLMETLAALLVKPGATAFVASVRRAHWESQLEAWFTSRSSHAHLAQVGEVMLDRYEVGPVRD